MQRAFAVFMGLHGAAHVIGFTVLWGLGGPRGLHYSTTVLNGAFDVGDLGGKLIGLWWLTTAAALLVVAAMLWRSHPAGLALAMGVLVLSLNLCLLCLPGPEIGLAIDLALLGLLAVTPGRLVARAATA